jgi:hypothetical protein
MGRRLDATTRTADHATDGDHPPGLHLRKSRDRSELPQDQGRDHSRAVQAFTGVEPARAAAMRPHPAHVGAYVGQVRDPQLVRPGRGEVTFDQGTRPFGLGPRAGSCAVTCRAAARAAQPGASAVRRCSGPPAPHAAATRACTTHHLRFGAGPLPVQPGDRRRLARRLPGCGHRHHPPRGAAPAARRRPGREPRRASASRAAAATATPSTLTPKNAGLQVTGSGGRVGGSCSKVR